MKQIRPKKQVLDVLNKKNKFRSLIFIMHNLYLDLNIFTKTMLDIEKSRLRLYKLFAIKNKTCKIQFSNAQ